MTWPIIDVSNGNEVYVPNIHDEQSELEINFKLSLRHALASGDESIKIDESPFKEICDVKKGVTCSQLLSWCSSVLQQNSDFPRRDVIRKISHLFMKHSTKSGNDFSLVGITAALGAECLGPADESYPTVAFDDFLSSLIETGNTIAYGEGCSLAIRNMYGYWSGMLAHKYSLRLYAEMLWLKASTTPFLDAQRNVVACDENNLTKPVRMLREKLPSYFAGTH